MRCDVIAEGVVSASKAVGLKVPLVVRMKGTNEDLGKKILAESGLPIISADTMAQAAERARDERTLRSLSRAPLAKDCPDATAYIESRLRGFRLVGGSAQWRAFGQALREGTYRSYQAFLDVYPSGRQADEIRSLLRLGVITPPPPMAPPRTEPSRMASICVTQFGSCPMMAPAAGGTFCYCLDQRGNWANGMAQ
jgi:hypothetical protein